MEQILDLDKAIPGWSTGKWTVPEWKFDRTPVLIINHMQEGIVGEGRISGAPKEQTHAYLDSHPYIIANQKKLLAAFREKKLPIFFISVVTNPVGAVPKWGFIFRMVSARSPLGTVDNPEVKELVQVIPEMGRRPEEPLLYHTLGGLFAGTSLEELMRPYGVQEMVITGFTAHSTVYNSVIEAIGKGYSVVIPRDSTGSPGRDQGCDEFVFDRLMPMYALVTTTDDVIKHLPQGK
jgi:nicotinamidase-related amidase